MRYFLLPVLVCLLAPGLLMLDTRLSVASEVYKWVDAEGRTHFGDKPPDSAGSATRIKTPTRSRASADPNADKRRLKQRKLLNALSTERKERKKLRLKAHAEKAALKQKCTRTKHSLAALERANLLYTKDKDGNRQYAGDARKMQIIKQLKASLKKHCSSG